MALFLLPYSANNEEELSQGVILVFAGVSYSRTIGINDYF